MNSTATAVNKMDEDSDTPQSMRKRLLSPLGVWYGWVGGAIALAAAGALVYLYAGSILSAVKSAYDAAESAVFTTLGFGTVPAALWLLAFALVLAYRRPWFRRANLWVASPVAVAVVMGILGLFEAQRGFLSVFTMDGSVSLGGRVGSAVAGPTAWLGVLRVLGLGVAAASIAFPRLALDLAVMSGRLAVVAWVFTIVGMRAAAGAIRRMYRFDRHRGAAEPARLQEDTVEAEEPGVVMAGSLPLAVGPRRVAAEVWPDSAPSALQEDLRPVSALPSAAPAVEEARSDTYADDVEELKSPAMAQSDVEEDDAAGLSGGAKYNKFWSSDRYQREGNLEAAAESTQLAVSVEDEAEGGDGPILDGASSWALPPADMLVDAYQGGISDEQMSETGETIKRTLGEYGVEVEIGETKPGPTVTMYGLVPGWVRRHKQVKVTDEEGNPKLDESGKPVVTRVETKTRVKVDSIMSREKDLALALKTPSIRIETPVMGKSLVGIEVPNPLPTLVTLRRVMESAEFGELRPEAKLPLALGKGSGGETTVLDMARMPHLLVAGSTGSGKSVFINAILCCFLMEKTPAELRLLLIDPKRVELTPYNGIPHLLTPVVVETDEVVALLKGLLREMNSRYRLMEEVGVRNIDGYNRKMSAKMPYLVVAIDELADLMMTASFDVEQSLCRLAQLGRATGIHLIVATQRPSVDVVTGLIKANFPSRVSFAVTSQIDSRTILDSTGAEKLVGRGDMLYQAVDASRPERVQGVFVSDDEIDDLVSFWKTTPWASMPKVSLHHVGDAETGDDPVMEEDEAGARDAMLDQAVDLAQRTKKLSTSLLQRRLRIGYPRAARLMDQLEEEGIVGPGDGSKSRDVIISGM